MEIPNLRQKATKILSRKMGEWFLGLEPREDPFLPQRNQVFFAVYSVAAAVYRWFIVLSIMLFLYMVWKPYGLEVIGSMHGMASLYGLLVYPLYQVGKFFYVPGRLDKVKKPRMYATLAGLIAIVAAILLVPFPYSVMCSLEIQARDAAPVYVKYPGVLEKVYVSPGEHVTQALDSPVEDNDLELGDQQAHFDARPGQDATRPPAQGDLPRFQRTAGDIPQQEAMIRRLDEQIAKKRVSEERCRPGGPGQRHDPAAGLVSPQGRPGHATTGLLVRNAAAAGEPGNFPQSQQPRERFTFCQVGDPQRLEAMLVIDGANVEFFAVGQKVEVKLDSYPYRTFPGTIEENRPERDESSTERALQQGRRRRGGYEARNPNTGVEKPLNVSYQASVPLDDPDHLLLLRLRGDAKVQTAPMTIFARLWRCYAHVPLQDVGGECRVAASDQWL